MDKAAEGQVESVIQTYVSVLISPWEACARALVSDAALLGCSPLPTALPSKQLHRRSSVITQNAYLLPFGFSLITATAAVLPWASAGKEQHLFLPWSKAHSIQWKIVKFNGLKLGAVPPRIRPFCHRWHVALGSETAWQFEMLSWVEHLKQILKSLMIHLQRYVFLFPALRVGMFWVLICKSVANWNEGEGIGFILTVWLESLWKWPSLSSAQGNQYPEMRWILSLVRISSHYSGHLIKKLEFNLILHIDTLCFSINCSAFPAVLGFVMAF